MPKADPATRIRKLLDAIRADFPRRKAAVEALLKQRYDMDGTIDLTVSPPKTFRSLPTFDPTRRRRPSPMLKARFAYASTIHNGQDIWLGPAEMERWMKKREVRGYHKALRKNWENCAPMRFPDHDLTLFIVTEGVPDNLTYLVWSGGEEPEICSYVGMEGYNFKDLAALLTWELERE
jgi:hypothetical protein